MTAILFVIPKFLLKSSKGIRTSTFFTSKISCEDFKLYIVILDYVPEVSLNEFQSVNGEYVFKERHIKNVGANRLDS